MLLEAGSAQFVKLKILKSSARNCTPIHLTELTKDTIPYHKCKYNSQSIESRDQYRSYNQSH